MPVAAVRARNAVVRPERGREADRDRLLSGVEVGRPVDLAAEDEALPAVLEAADEEHPPVQLREGLDVLGERRRGRVSVAPHTAAARGPGARGPGAESP